MQQLSIDIVKIPVIREISRVKRHGANDSIRVASGKWSSRISEPTPRQRFVISSPNWFHDWWLRDQTTPSLAKIRWLHRIFFLLFLDRRTSSFAFQSRACPYTHGATWFLPFHNSTYQPSYRPPRTSVLLSGRWQHSNDISALKILMASCARTLIFFFFFLF